MTLLPFDLQKALAGHPVVTKDGQNIIEIFRTKSLIYPVVAITDVNQTPHTYTECGHFQQQKCPNNMDLFLLAPEPKKVKRWINLYNFWALHDTPEKAAKERLPNCIACIPIEFVEGEGLEKE